MMHGLWNLKFPHLGLNLCPLAGESASRVWTTEPTGKTLELSFHMGTISFYCGHLLFCKVMPPSFLKNLNEETGGEGKKIPKVSFSKKKWNSGSWVLKFFSYQVHVVLKLTSHWCLRHRAQDQEQTIGNCSETGTDESKMPLVTLGTNSVCFCIMLCFLQWPWIIFCNDIRKKSQKWQFPSLVCFTAWSGRLSFFGFPHDL